MSTTLKISREQVAEYAAKHREALRYHEQRYGNARPEAQDLPLPPELELALGNINDWVNGGDSLKDRVADLSGLDLSGMDLSDANLSFAVLDNADLTNTDLSNSVLRYTELKGATLTDTRMNGAYLIETNLENASINTDLSTAAVRENVNTQGATGDGANIAETERTPHAAAFEAAMAANNHPPSIDDDWQERQEIPAGLLLGDEAPEHVAGGEELPREATAEELIEAHYREQEGSLDGELQKLLGEKAENPLDAEIARAHDQGDRQWANKLLDMKLAQQEQKGKSHAEREAARRSAAVQDGGMGGPA